MNERAFRGGGSAVLVFFKFNKLQHYASLVWSIYEHILQKRRYPNEVTIRTLINALCKEGKVIEEERIEEGMVLLKRMLQKSMILDTISYSLIVCAKVNLGNLEYALEVYEEMLNRGFTSNSFVYTSFIGAYCREGNIEKANCLMQEMEKAGLK
ncbi:hypothetical protein EZV62_028151 [Acer yangbiense]|uniref:Pentacotripeptide-repeat region of PRORP domain-containing protein n=1 Tax=Acer yangbiense TaxID=1000413 RepID=A0A5C7GNH1_9ROSI|nr:hypothetical protein EZV62_028151 [Acer yangbiense]